PIPTAPTPRPRPPTRPAACTCPRPWGAPGPSTVRSTPSAGPSWPLRIDDELFGADWAQAKARVGEGVSGADLARTPAQRRADALVEMARRAGSVPAGARMPEPLFSVLVGYETFAGRICELADGTVVAPGALVGWLGEGWVERVVFDGPDRVRNVGVGRRIFAGATRRAVEVRDRECFHELCEVPAQDCEIDHVLPWSAGGPTGEDNGRPACGFTTATGIDHPSRRSGGGHAVRDPNSALMRSA